MSPTPAVRLVLVSALVAAVARAVSVGKSLAEKAPVKFPVTQTRTVIFGRSLVVAFVAELKALAASPILAPFFYAVVIASIQRRLA